VKLLLDQNLSPRLLPELSVLYTGSAPFATLGWSERTTSPSGDTRPSTASSVIWIRHGNSSTDDILGLLRVHQPAILAFNEDPETAFLALG
jgi:predicted nuclease of predicted toxin-antitoxin system